MNVNVGTRNPLKVKAVRAAFEEVFEGESLNVKAVSVEAGIPSQPFGEEVIRGAIRRARGALGDAAFGVGIEAGLIQLPGCDRSLNVQFCVLIDQSAQMTVGHGPGFELPLGIVKQLEQGSTLNCEMSRLTGIPEIKETIGAIGVLSGGRIDRFSITREAVLMALVPRIGGDLTPSARNPGSSM